MQIAYAGPRFGATFNTFVGAELPNDNKHLRLLGDWIATYQATKQLTFAGSLDRGRQSLPNDAAANWLGASIWARYSYGDRHAFATRVERFHDPDNGISGTPQTLTGATVTYELRPDKNLIVKIEGRHDRSNAPVFSKSRGEMTNNEMLVLVGVVATF
jgi:hypothetical protein